MNQSVGALTGEGWLHRNIDWLGLAGTVFGLLAIIVAIIVYFRQRQRKTLDWTVTGVFPLLSLPSEYHGPAIEVLANGQPVGNPIVTGIMVINTGTEPLRSDDFEKPVTFSFPAATINTFALVEFPDDTQVYIDTSKDRKSTQVKFGSLNRGESFTVQFLVDGKSAEVEVTSRIIGETRAMYRLTEVELTVALPIPFANFEVGFTRLRKTEPRTPRRRSTSR